MTFYDYKVVPAPKRLKRIKGVKSTADLFSATLSETLNLQAREGWEYVRAETLPASEEGGWFRRGAEVVETVLIFRRPREQMGPRLAAAARAEVAPDPAHDAAYEPVPARAAPERAAPERAAPERAAYVERERPQPGPLRREPRLGASPEPGEAPTPLRPGPRLGPADRT